MRRVVATVVGFLVGGFVTGLVQAINHVVFPLPPDVDPFNPEHMVRLREILADAPPAAFVVVLASWLIGSFAGGLVAGRIARLKGPPLIVGTVLLLAAIYNLVNLPHPLWVTIAAVVGYLPAAWLGGRVGVGDLATTARTSEAVEP